MSAQAFETALARLYTDPDFRSRFLADPESALADQGLTCEERNDLIGVDRAGLVMAAQSFARKRSARRTRPDWRAWVERFWWILPGILIGCSSRPPMRPVNEIKEPVFHRLDYLAAGILVGGEFTRDSSDDAHEPGLLSVPRMTFVKNVSPWASFSLWPLYWNLLLTGDQYGGGGNLEAGRLHMAAHGGLNALGYGSRDGWFLGAALGLRGKYLLDDRLFLRADLLAEFADLAAPGKFRGSLVSGLGCQVSPMHSVLVSHTLTVHNADQGRYFLRHGLRHFDGDLGNEIRLGHKAYLTPSHIVGPEIGYGFRNGAIGSEGYFLVGLKYRYVVE